MNKDELNVEFENLSKVLQKIDAIITLNTSGKFIIAHEKTIGVRQMVMNSLVRIKSHIGDENVQA
jgi:hypothetical protein